MCKAGVLLSFQLTRLMRGVTLTLCGLCMGKYVFQLTRLMRGVTPDSGRHRQPW